jgi:hypothetical protein
MSVRPLLRLSGIALIGGGILLAIGSAISSLFLPQGLIGIYSAPLAISAFIIRIVGAIFLLMGLPAIFVRQAQGVKAVTLSLIACIVTFVGVAVLEVGMNSIYAFIFPPLATNPATQPVLIALDAHRPLGASLAFGVGLLGEVFGPLLLGIAITRAKVLPRLAGVMFIIVPVLTIVGLPDVLLVQAIAGVAVAAAFGLGFVLCGAGLLNAQGEERRQETPERVPERELVKR